MSEWDGVMTAEQQVTVTFGALSTLIARVVEVGHNLAAEGHIDHAEALQGALEGYIATMQEHTLP